MDRSFVQVIHWNIDHSFLMKICVYLGKPNEVLASAEHLLSPSGQTTETSIPTTHRAMVDIEEQVIQTESALQNEEEQRCTGREAMIDHRRCDLFI